MKDVTIHPTATVDQGAKIGANTKIWHYSHVCGTDVEIGPDCSLGQNTYVGPKTKIGKGCRIQNNVSIYDLVELGDYVFCGPSMVFTNVINPRAHIPRKEEFKKTIVENGVSFGANCTVVCGTTIGRYAFIGAGAVITKDVPAFALMMGVPARLSGWMCHCGVKLSDHLGETTKATCKACGSSYTITPDSCRPEKLIGGFESK